MFEGRAGVSPAGLTVTTSDHGGHSPEQVSEICVNRLISISESAPPEIADQARAFRGDMLSVVNQCVKMAAREERRTICHKLEQAGFPDLARQIRDI